jgi:hypothetical protein
MQVKYFLQNGFCTSLMRQQIHSEVQIFIPNRFFIILGRYNECNSHCASVLTARQLGSRIRIPLDVWLSVRVFQCRVILCLATDRPLVHAVLPTVEKTVPKPHIRKRCRFSRNLRAAAKNPYCCIHIYNIQELQYKQINNSRFVKFIMLLFFGATKVFR